MFENDYLRDRVEAALATHRTPARVTGEIAGRYIILTLSEPVQNPQSLTDDVRRATGAHTVEIVGLGTQQALVVMWQADRPAVAAEPRHWFVADGAAPVSTQPDVTPRIRGVIVLGAGE